MREIKDTARSLVRIGYDGAVHKTFRGDMARERFENEVRVLRFLESRQCPFVPRLIDCDEEGLRLSTTNAGQRVDRVTQEALDSVFGELEGYGVRHQDQAARNLTYNPRLSRFCVIDFEFALILEPGHPEPPPAPPPDPCPLVNR
jgi:predicted Ser/Thr protein kinase